MRKSFRRMFVISLSAGVIAGLLSGAASSFYILKTRVPKIVTVDIKKMVEDKKYDLFRRFQDKKENSEKLENEYRQFVTKLDSLLDSYVSDKTTIIVRKEALIDGNYKDVTEEMKRRMKDLEE